MEEGGDGGVGVSSLKVGNSSSSLSLTVVILTISAIS